MIVTHTNSDKSCFKQMKLYPDIMPTFFIMVADFMYLQPSLSFGGACLLGHQNPSRETVPRQITSNQASQVFGQTPMGKSLVSEKKGFIQAKSFTKRQGVLDDTGQPVSTPQSLFVGYSVYAEVYEHNRDRIK